LKESLKKGLKKQVNKRFKQKQDEIKLDLDDHELNLD